MGICCYGFRRKMTGYVYVTSAGFPVKASNPPVQCPAVVLMTRMASASKSGFTPLSTFISVSSPSFVIVKLRVTLPCIPAFFSILGVLQMAFDPNVHFLKTHVSVEHWSLVILIDKHIILLRLFLAESFYTRK